MFPTHKMIEAACNAAKAELYPSEFAMRAALTAALALLSGEPIGFTGASTMLGLRNGVFGTTTIGGEKNARFSEPLYASPALQHVAKGERG